MTDATNEQRAVRRVQYREPAIRVNLVHGVTVTQYAGECKSPRRARHRGEQPSTAQDVKDQMAISCAAVSCMELKEVIVDNSEVDVESRILAIRRSYWSFCRRVP